MPKNQEVYSMYTNQNRTQVIKEKAELEAQINKLIADYENRWKPHFFELKVLPISEIKNNLPYNLQKGGRIQLFLTGDS